MKIHQLSVFLENKPGALAVPVKLLADAGLNLDTLALADSSEYGILRLIMREWEQAKTVLQAAGCTVNVVELVAVDVPDAPGGLASVLDAIAGSGVNIEYMYGFPSHADGQAALVLRFDQPDRALEALGSAGIGVLSLEEFVG